MSESTSTDANLNELIKHVVSTMDANAAATGGATQKKWFNFSVNAETKPIYDKDYLKTAFNRDRLNKTVTDIAGKDKQEAGDMGKVKTAMQQLDIMASWHRDSTSRFKSRVRVLAHRASEVSADGTDYGPLRTAMVRYLKAETGENTSSEVLIAVNDQDNQSESIA